MTMIKQQLAGFRLTTAEILYHMPDFPAMLQSFVWQDMDRAPDFPRLARFLRFWRANLDGRLHSVRVGHCEALAAPKISAATVLTLH